MLCTDYKIFLYILSLALRYNASLETVRYGNCPTTIHVSGNCKTVVDWICELYCYRRLFYSFDDAMVSQDLDLRLQKLWARRYGRLRSTLGKPLRILQRTPLLVTALCMSSGAPWCLTTNLKCQKSEGLL